MKFTVIGSKGYIGSKLCSKLRARGCEVFTPEKGEQIDFGRSLGRVIYCAGLTNDFDLRVPETIEAHVCFLNYLLGSADYESFTYLSSTRLYDGQPHGVHRESDDLLLNPLNTRHVFDLSKALGEALVLRLAGERGRVARLSCVYSADPDAGGFLPSLIRTVAECRASQVKSVSVETSETFARDYVALDDVVRALIILAECTLSGIFNVAAGENTTNRFLFNCFKRISGVVVEPQFVGESTPIGQVSIDKMRNTFGWQPRTVEQGIVDMLRRTR